MSINFNRQRCLKLLEKQNFFHENNKLFAQENPEEYMELLSYGTRLEDQIGYNRKTEYYSLITDYLAGDPDTDTFVSLFFIMSREDQEELDILMKKKEKLLSFKVNSQSDGFSELLGKIYVYCDAVVIGKEPENSFEMSEDEFKKELKLFFLDLQKYLDK